MRPVGNWPVFDRGTLTSLTTNAGETIKVIYHGELFIILEGGHSCLFSYSSMPWYSKDAVRAIILCCDKLMLNDVSFVTKVYNNWPNYFKHFEDAGIEI